MTVALIYVRQSRHKAYEATTSPEVQEETCRALAAVSACGEVIVYSDLDVSGGKRARRGYEALLARLEEGDVEVIAAYDQSRLFRSSHIAAEFMALMNEKRHKHVAVVYVSGAPFDRSPIGHFTHSQIAAANQLYKDMTGEKIRAAYAKKNAAGLLTGTPPFGYARDDEGALLVVEDRADVVRRIFELYVTGDYSTHSLARRLNDEAVTPPGASRFGWLPDTVADILRNVAYAGKTYTVSRERHEGEVIRATWEAIIDEATFGRTQDILGARRVQRTPAPAETTFGRLLVCAKCGEPMRTKVTGKARRRVYHCRRDVPAGSLCPASPVREDYLEAWASSLFASLESLSRESLDGAALAARDRRRTPGASAEAVAVSLEKLSKLFTWGHIDEEAYLAEHGRLEALRAELTAESRESVDVFAMVRDVRAAWGAGTPAERRALLGTFFEKLYVEDKLPVRFVARREHRDEIEELVSRVTNGTFELEVDLPVTRTGRPFKHARTKVRVAVRELREVSGGSGPIVSVAGCGAGGVSLRTRHHFRSAAS